jgi:hypothetical protein
VNFFFWLWPIHTYAWQRLVDAAAPAALLIHEATFEDQLQHQAVSKRHSTVTEALDAGQKMQAAHTLLTHFSQRYASGPEIPRDHAHAARAILAFDGLRLDLPGALSAAAGPDVIDTWRASAAWAAKNLPASEI